jgi:hypothetical protein
MLMRTYRTLAALAAGLVLAAIASPASAAVNHEANHPSYWQTDTTTCTKVEMTGAVSTWTLPAPVDGSTYALLVLKAGTVNDVFVAPVAGVAYAPASGKDISHVIVCVGADDGGGGGVIF